MVLLHAIVACLIVTVCTTASSANSIPHVKLATGEVEGLTGVSRSGREFHKFLGIPYGKVSKRFAISEPADPWSGVKKATDSGEGCISYDMFGGGVSGSENCLTLDIYKPITNSSNGETKLLEVMVWIYGGGFISGSTNSYDGNFFMDKDVVLVLMNYRLGAIGFLNMGTSTARGNQGLKDQVLALRWVQDNIAHFSGDKEKVTIFGESAGSVSVSLMLTSPMTRDGGLFHRAIMQSGTSLMPSIYNGADGPTLARRLGQAVDCPTSNDDYLVECLQKIDPKILGGFGKFNDEFGYDENAIIVGPSFEMYNQGENDDKIFMSEDPYVSAKNGKIAKVPTIIGLMHTESGWSASPVINNSTTLNRLNFQWTRRLASMLYMSKTAEDPGSTSERIKQQFFDGKKVSNDSRGVAELEHLLDERHWIHPVRILAPQLFKHNGGFVYLYNFTKPMLSLPPPFGNGLQRKASHGDDVKFFFGIRGYFAKFMPGLNEDETKLSKSLVDMWVEFAKQGKPKPLWGAGSETGTETIKHWPPAFTASDTTTADHQLPTFLYIDDEPNVNKVGDWYKNNGEFWDGLSLKEYGKKWVSEN